MTLETRKKISDEGLKEMVERVRVRLIPVLP